MLRAALYRRQNPGQVVHQDVSHKAGAVLLFPQVDVILPNPRLQEHGANNNEVVVYCLPSSANHSTLLPLWEYDQRLWCDEWGQGC